MTLDEAILHAEEVADKCALTDGNIQCENDHRQLAKWLKDYKRLKEQEPKTGHWEWVQYDYNPKIGNWHCSECRCIVVECVGKKEKGGIPLYKYCPQCGAKMVEPQESEDKK